MTDRRVLLNGTGTNGDGSTWDDASDATSAYIGQQGFEAAQVASAAGDRIFGKGASSGNSGSSIFLNNDLGISATTNQVQCIGVRSDASVSVAKTDVILGLREGNATRAYAQTGGEAPPKVLDTGQSIAWNGASYFYGFIFDPGDNSTICNLNSIENNLMFEECHFDVATGGNLTLGGSDNYQRRATFRHCLFTMGARLFRGNGPGTFEFYDCEFTGSVAGFIRASSRFVGTFKFVDCDFTGCNATLVDISLFLDGRVEFWNCRMPSGHILTTGTAVAFYTVINYGSEDNTGFNSADSEQEYESNTHQGTVDIEITKVRTGGADDEATDSGGPFSYALTPNNVADNFVAVVSPQMDLWVEGDGTAKTLTVFIANDGAGDLEDDELRFEVAFPSEAGISMHDYRPDDGAPGDGGGYMQLLGTAVVIDDDTGSAWGGSVGNHQKLSQSIAPDYRGPIYCWVHYSKSGGAVMYVDPLPTVV